MHNNKAPFIFICAWNLSRLNNLEKYKGKEMLKNNFSLAEFLIYISQVSKSTHPKSF